jgi:hypothetical protein
MPTDPLTQAFDRLDDFVTVQCAAGGITVDAVRLLQQAVGIDDVDRATIRERVEALAPADSGSVLVGIMVGLLAADRDAGDRFG